MPKKLPWYRMYLDVRTDAKLRTLTYEEKGCWLDILSYAAEQDERGTIPSEKASERDLLAVECARGDIELLERVLVRLVKLKIISIAKDGALTFIHFLERQYDNPSDLPEAVHERQRAHRDRQQSRAVTTDNDSSRPDNEDGGVKTSDNPLEERRGEKTQKRVVGDSPTPPTDDPPRPRGKSPAEHIESPAHSVQAECYQAMMEENRQAGRTGTEIVPPDVVRQQCIIMAKAVKKVGPNADHVAMIRRYCHYLIAGRAGPVTAEQITAGITGWINSGQPAPQPRSNGYVQPAPPPAPVGKYPAGRRATA